MSDQPRADNPRITITLAPHVLAKLDRLAETYGLNRSGVLTLLVVQATESDLVSPRPRRRYNPSRGGHAPGHLREAFQEWLDADSDSDWVEIDGERHPIDWLLGKLWNSSDVLPASYCQDLDIPQGSTYAQAVRRVKADRGGEPLGETPDSE